MKVFNYLFICLGLAFIFELAGMPVATDMLTRFGLNINSGSTLETSAFYLAVFGITGILIGIGTAVVIGTFTKSNPENYIILPLIVTSIILFSTTFTGIINYALNNFPGWISYITMFIMGLLGAGFVLACVEFFRGTD